MSELLIGAGSCREKLIGVRDGLVYIYPSENMPPWLRLTTLDNNADHAPDVLADLREALPFSDECFDEIHAYEVLEHVGQQGDYIEFFRLFGELWRILKPGGLLLAKCPSWRGMWAWGDPSHTRVISSGTLTFLDQREYEKQVGKTPMSDFRGIWKRSFETMFTQEDGDTHYFILRKA